MYRADRDLYWNEDRTILLEEGDVRSRWRAIHKRQFLTDKVLEETKVEVDPETETMILPSEDAFLTEAEEPKKTVLEMNKDELKSFLEANSVEFNSSANKAELLELAQSVEVE